MEETLHFFEVLVKKAAADPAFREQLLSDRSAAASAIGLKLSEDERMVIDCVHAERLARVIELVALTSEEQELFRTQSGPELLSRLRNKACPFRLGLSLGIRPDGTVDEVEISDEQDREIVPPGWHDQ